MAIFSRLISRFRADTSTRAKTRPRKLLLRFEPLEDRRMLACDASYGLMVDNVSGQGNEDVVKLQWNTVGVDDYDIQSSISGLVDEAVPETGLWQTIETVPAGFVDRTIDRFRSLYYRIRSVTASDWSCVAYTTTASEDNVVKVSAAVLPGVEMITLRWPEELKFENSTYTISRKAKDDLTWTELVTGDTGNDWVDFDVEEGKAYEYEVKRSSANGNGNGYVYAGLELALDDADSTIESPGTVILVVDNTQAAALVTELARLENDLIAEGWKVNRLTDVAPHITPDPNDPVPDQITNRDNAINIRQAIVYAHGASYDQATGTYDVKAVFLIGHVPIPMSGHNCPDGHGERPMPTDLFYGEMDGVVDIDDDPGGDWTDATQVPDAPCLLSSADIDNNPDDGAFDQKDVPLDGDGKPVELMVGRVDMRDLPEFQLYDPDMDETELLRRYLDKDHAFRTGQVAVERKARIRDRFARTYSSTGAWQTLSGFFGPAESPTELEPDNIDVNKWTDTTWPLVMGLRSIGSGDLDGAAVGRRGSIATRDLTCCSRSSNIRVVFKRTRTPYFFSWETAL